MNLAEIQNYVWQQTDTTAIDLPAALIEEYVDEAFQRTIAVENQWPMYEQAWQVRMPADGSFAPLEAEVNVPAIMSVRTVDDDRKLPWINQEEAEARFSSQAVDNYVWPRYWSVWGRELYLWPRATYYEDGAEPPDDQDEPVEVVGGLDLVMRGYRKPLKTFRTDTGEVDADERFHRPLAHYATALAYAREESREREDVYMHRWQRDVEMVRSAVMDPTNPQPIVMHGNWPRRGVNRTGVRGHFPAGGVVINTPGS